MELTAKLPEGILREAITPQKKNGQFLEILKQKHICGDLEDFLEENEDLYFQQGFLYRKAADNKVIAFVLFNSEILGEGIGDYDKDTRILGGVLRCSGQKGLGRIIQSDMEDYAKFHKYQYIRIDVGGGQDLKKYYMEKLKYEKLDKGSSYFFKEINLSKGGRRKTRKNKKAKKQTRKHK
jgi:hypothetical protein